MKRSEMIRLLTAFCNFNTFKTIDEFSGDYMMTLEEGDKVLTFLENKGMLPPTLTGYTQVEEHENQLTIKLWGWEDEDLQNE